MDIMDISWYSNITFSHINNIHWDIGLLSESGMSFYNTHKDTNLLGVNPFDGGN